VVLVFDPHGHSTAGGGVERGIAAQGGRRQVRADAEPRFENVFEGDRPRRSEPLPGFHRS